jgi:hypothetical protein
MENACCTCAVGHYVTNNELFLTNKAPDLCGVIHALRQSTIWTDRWMKPATSHPPNPCFWQNSLRHYSQKRNNVKNIWDLHWSKLLYLIYGNKMLTRCNTWFFIADLIACSTCFGHHYAHHQELESIIQLVAACGLWYLVFKLSVWCGAEGCVSGLRAAPAAYAPAR